MSNFNFNGPVNNATISLGNGENITANLSVKVDGKVVIKKKEISAKIENGVLIINSTK